MLQGEKPEDTGNGIAVYGFVDGKVAPERFIAIEPQPLEAGAKIVALELRRPPGTAIPYPAGLALVSGGGRDRLLVANNLSDNVVLLDVASGKDMPALRRQHKRSGAIFVSLYGGGYARWPPCLVQPVERVEDC